MVGGGQQDDGESAISMDVMEMFQGMPIVSVLMFQQDAYGSHPEDIVADLLQQVYSQERIDSWGGQIVDIAWPGRTIAGG